jgi:hypothetical protein
MVSRQSLPYWIMEGLPVRRKPRGRRTRDLCKLNGASEGCRSSREWSRPVKEEPVHLCKDESMAEVSLGGERKRMSGCNVFHQLRAA